MSSDQVGTHYFVVHLGGMKGDTPINQRLEMISDRSPHTKTKFRDIFADPDIGREAKEFLELSRDSRFSELKTYDLRIGEGTVPATLFTYSPVWKKYEDKISEHITHIISGLDNTKVDRITALYSHPYISYYLYTDTYDHPLKFAFDINDSDRERGDLDRRKLFEGIVSILVNNKERKETPPLRPRWAEENRPKKQVKLRLEPNLIEAVDEAAKGKDLSRNDWIERAIRKALREPH